MHRLGRQHCRDVISRLMANAGNPHESPQRPGPTLPGLGHRTLHKVAETMTAAKALEERQLKQVWTALGEAGLTRKVHSVVRSILWKQLLLA